MSELFHFEGTSLSARLVGNGPKECLVIGGIGSHHLDFAPLAKKTGRTFFVVQNPFHEGIQAWDSFEKPDEAVQPVEEKKKRKGYPQAWRPWFHNQLERVFNTRPWEEMIGHSCASEPLLEKQHPTSLRRITFIGAPTVERLRFFEDPTRPVIGEKLDDDIRLLRTTLSELSARMEQKVFDDMVIRHLELYGRNLRTIMQHEQPSKHLPDLETIRRMIQTPRADIELLFIKDKDKDPWHDDARFVKAIDGRKGVRWVDCISGHYGHVGDTETVAGAVNQPYIFIRESSLPIPMHW